jgi:hypothetical protein
MNTFTTNDLVRMPDGSLGTVVGEDNPLRPNGKLNVRSALNGTALAVPEKDLVLLRAAQTAMEPSVSQPARADDAAESSAAAA